MFYAFTTRDRWDRAATIVAAADSLEHYNEWINQHARNAKASPENFYDECRAISFREKMQDSRYKGFRYSLYEFSHFTETQQARFIERHELKIVSNDVARERHEYMVKAKQPDTFHEGPEDERKVTIAELIGEPLRDNKRLKVNQNETETEQAKSPIDVVDIYAKDNKIEVNSIYVGVNANPEVPDEVKEASRETLLERYAHVFLPNHDVDLPTLQKLARQDITATGWFYFLDTNTVIFRYEVDSHKFLQRFRLHRSIKSPDPTTDLIDLQHNPLDVAREELPEALRVHIKEDRTVCYVYPEVAVFNRMMIVPADKVLATHNATHVMSIRMDQSVACLAISDAENNAYVVIVVDGHTKTIVWLS